LVGLLIKKKLETNKTSQIFKPKEFGLDENFVLTKFTKLKG